MHGRALIAAALGVVGLAAAPRDGAAAPARSPSVTVRQSRWVGLQIDIARLRRGGGVMVKAKQAYGSVTSLQPVGQMCRHCVVGINADFFDTSTRQPIGGVIVNGVVLRSPNTGQNQLTFRPDGRITAGTMHWLGHLSSGDLTMPVAVNDPNATTPVLFDRRYGWTTPAGSAIELAFVLHPSALFL